MFSLVFLLGKVFSRGLRVIFVEREVVGRSIEMLDLRVKKSFLRFISGEFLYDFSFVYFLVVIVWIIFKSLVEEMFY